MTHAARAVASMVLVSLLPGCGMYERGRQVGSYDEVLRKRTEERPSSRWSATASQDGLRLEVHAVRHCKQVEVERVRHVREFDRVSTASTWMVVVAAMGAASAAGGGYMLATADRHPEEVPAGSDELTRSQAQLAGGLFVGMGTAAVLASLIHWGVVAREDRTSEIGERDGSIVSRDVACGDPEPARGVDVWLATRGGRVRLGSTGPDGSLVADLANTVPRSAIVGATWEHHATVGAGDEPVGKADLAPVRAWYEARAWARADPETCAAPSSSDSCDGVRGYLAAFPGEAHAEEAERLVHNAQAVLQQMAQREEAERKAAAEQQRRLEEEQRAAAERERLEAERRRQEVEQRRRAEEARYERELERRKQARERQREQAEREARERRQRRAARSKCQASCRSSCEGAAKCYQECVRTQCR